MSSPTTIAAVVAAATLSALAATGHPWMAGAGLLLALGALVFQSWQESRTRVARHQDALLYSRTPVPLRPCRDLELDSARHEDDLRTGRWVHLDPSPDYW